MLGVYVAAGPSSTASSSSMLTPTLKHVGGDIREGRKRAGQANGDHCFKVSSRTCRRIDGMKELGGFWPGFRYVGLFCANGILTEVSI